MIKVHKEGALRFTEKGIPDNLLQKASHAYRQIVEGSGKGSEWLGWRRILEEPDQALHNRVISTAARIREDADIFIICGIGGSYLGARAVIEALKGPFSTESPEMIFAGQHIGGRYLKNLIQYLDEPKPDGKPKSVYLNVISKSGSTLETALAFRLLRGWMEKTYGEGASGRIIATTGPEGGILNNMTEEFGYEKFTIPEDTGGRFSVLTPVGLLPVAVAGVDIQQLVSGAVSAYGKYEKSAEDLLEYAALRFQFHESGKHLDVIGSFEPELQPFTGWIQQLLGESEGKDGKGIFPVPAAYSTDLHSIGQMVQDGRRNIIETMLVVEEERSGLKVPEEGRDTDGLEYLSGRTVHDINRQARMGTVEAHLNGGVPVIQIAIQELNEENMGHLIYFYELFAAIYVYMLGVNPFDQPGVEAYKKEMYRNLGKV